MPKKFSVQPNRKNVSNRSRENVLVTGAAGFIGANLSQKLLSLGYSVVGVDNFITGQKKNLMELFRSRRFRFFELDITRANFVTEISKLKFSQIYHLASPTGVPNIGRYAEEMLLTNSLGTLNVMEIARSQSAKVLFTSSAEVYGQAEVFPQSERYFGNVNPIGQRSPYEEGKRFAESVVTMYQKKYQVSVRIVRIFNAYGPKMSLQDQRVIPQFFRYVAMGEKLVVYGDGKNERTFVYIDDLIRGLLLVMDKGKNGEVYNLGGNQKISIKDLARIIMDLFQCFRGIRFQSPFIEDHHSRQPSLLKVQSLGWEEKTSLLEGLKKMQKEMGLASVGCSSSAEMSIKRETTVKI